MTDETSSVTRPVACVMGGMDIVRPLGIAGIRSCVVAAPGRPQRYSRFTVAVVDVVDPWRQPERLVESLISFARSRADLPVLFYENDGYLALVSRFRVALSAHFRFVAPDAELVEGLLDKARFIDLATRLDLPVPPTRHIPPGLPDLDLDVPYPIIVKPLTRDDRDRGWVSVGGNAKAIHLDSAEAFRRAVPAMRAAQIGYVVQTAIRGPESAIESYHVYAAGRGDIIAEFTGRKIRTSPPAYGHSTALTTTDAPDVVELGRRIVKRLELPGVAKLDFKRDDEGRLHLLEVNPRFTLWNHLGARAGVNIPALVFADLAGTPRPPIARSVRQVTWCDPVKDLGPARAASIPTVAWLRWVASCTIKTDFAWDDPMPFVRGRVMSRLSKTVRRRTAQ